MHRITRLSLVSAFCLMIAACGSGGGGGGGGDVAAAAAGGGGGGGGTGSTPTGDGPGQRAVPGYVLSAEKTNAATPGSPLIVRVTIAPQSGSPAITGVEVWLGLNEYATPASTSPATPVAGLGNSWDVTTTLPSPLPTDATLWLRLTTADGSVIEVGQDAFQIATLPGA